MRHVVKRCLNFYFARSAAPILLGLVALFVAVLSVDPTWLWATVGIGLLGVGIPLRMYALYDGVWLALEEERQFTHQRLVALEGSADGSESHS